MRIWGVELELGSQLMRQPVRVRIGNISCEFQPVQRGGPEQLRQHHTTTAQKCRTCTPQHWIGASNGVNHLQRAYINGEANKRGSPCPSGHNSRRDKAWLDATRRAAELLRVFRGICRVPRLDCGKTYHKCTKEQANACAYGRLSGPNKSAKRIDVPTTDPRICHR